MSKKGKQREFRHLAEEAWNRELAEELAHVESAIADWRRGNISALDVSDYIHDFHAGARRSLHKQYTTLDAEVLVAQAVARGVLERREVGDQLLAELERKIEAFQQLDALQANKPLQADRATRGR